MDELAARRAAKELEQLENLVGELCLSVPAWLIRRMSQETQNAVFHLAVQEAKDRLRRPR